MRNEVSITIDTANAQQLIAELRDVVIRFETSVKTLSVLCAVLDKTVAIPDYPKSFA